MRIIAGKLGGRKFDSPKGHRTHPMSEKVRGAIFSSLGDIKDLAVLDAFAGSGALAFEAISRGASFVTAIEIDKHAHRIIVENAEELGLTDNIKIIRANSSGWSDNNPEKQFDIVLLDPPYGEVSLNLLQKLTRHLTATGILVLSWPGKAKEPEFKNLQFIKSKKYGDSQLVFYKKIT